MHVKACSGGQIPLALSRLGLLIFFVAVQVIHVLSSPWTSLSQESAVSTPNKGDRNKYHRQTSKKCSCPLVAQLGEEAMCEEWECRAEKVSNKADPS